MSFVQQREKRANAGSRMRALLDKEADMEELFELDESEDEAFSEVDDEQMDTVDSDFDMDESEGEAEQEQLAEEEEKRIRQAERQAKRPNIRQQQYSRKPALPRHSAIHRTTTSIEATKPRRAITETSQHPVDLSNRQSMRTKTILNRMHVEEQIRESESKRARLPKRRRPEMRHLTQEELLAEAAVTEQENRSSLEQWQQKEAERQAKAKTKVKRGIQGPSIRYHSFTDGTINERPHPRKLVMILDGAHGNTTQVDITDPSVLDFHYRRDVEECDISTRNHITFFPGDPTDAQKNTTANDENAKVTDDQLEINKFNNKLNDKLQHIKTDGLSDRELDRLDRIPQLASWADRSARPIKPLPCLITAKESHYREPMTHTPYADATSYSHIKSCLDHRYIWSPSLGIFVGNESDSKGAEGVPDGWERMIEGKRPEESDWKTPFPTWMAAASKESSLSQTEQQEKDAKPTRKRQRHRV